MRRTAISPFSLILVWTLFAVFAGTAFPGCTPEDDGELNNGSNQRDAGDTGTDDGGTSDTGTLDTGPSDVGASDTDMTDGREDARDEELPGSGPQITVFALNSQESDISLTAGEDLLVEWEAIDADECQAQGDFPGWQGPLSTSGEQTLSTDAGQTLQTFSVGLLCSGSGETDQVTRSVEIVDVCEGVTPLEDDPEWARATDVLWPFDEDEAQTFETIFSPWPGTGNSENVGVLKGEYIAASFETGALDSSSGGQLRTEDPATATSGQYIGTGRFIASMSRCPGDFDPASPAIAPGCVKAIRAVDQFRWGGPGSGEHCELESNTEYYLNIVYTNSDVGELPPEQATCDEQKPRCGHIYAPRGQE